MKWRKIRNKRTEKKKKMKEGVRRKGGGRDRVEIRVVA